MGAMLEQEATLDSAFHMPTYARKPVMFLSGDGMRLVDDEGREYLDFVSGIGAVNLGHSHPAVVRAVSEQVRRLTHVSNLFYVEHRDELCERLAGLFAASAQIAAGDGHPAASPHAWKTFLANSGAEAGEGAVKLARKWGKAQRGAECVEIVTALRSFHGRTISMLAATGQPSKQEAFEPLTPGFSHVPLNDLPALEAAVTDRTCAVMLEPVQGEGGVYPCEPDYLIAVRELCDRRGVLLLLDEVQTGCWRTGTFLACESYGVLPDIVMLAKALANGLPIGAVVARAEIADAFQPGDHGSTFGGGPVICAAALATLEALETEHLGERAVEVGTYLREGLANLSDKTGQIAHVRGRGLMNAAHLTRPVAAEAASAMLERGFVVNNIGPEILRMLPPLVCTTSEVDTLLDALDSCVTAAKEGVR